METGGAATSYCDAMGNGNATVEWDFRLLGPVSARFRGGAVNLGGPKARSLLALLLLNVERIVSTSALVEGLWGEEAPAGSVGTLQVHVGNVRKALALAAPGPSPLTTQAPGYVMSVPAVAVDLHRFRRLIGEEQRAGADTARARLLRTEALEQWTGSPLDGLEDEPFARPVIVRLVEERLSAYERHVRDELDLGRHAEVVGELIELAQANPMREQLVAQLMLALYRSGRQSDSLAAFRRLREHLRDELGLEPSPELRRLEGEVLRQSDQLQWAGVGAPSSAARTTVVRRFDGDQAPATLQWAGRSLTLGVSCTIGRDDDNTVVLDDAEASRHHAVIRGTSEGFTLVDRRSTNGTFVNGALVSENRLADGDVIRIGATDLSFVWAAGPDPRAEERRHGDA